MKDDGGGRTRKNRKSGLAAMKRRCWDEGEAWQLRGSLGQMLESTLFCNSARGAGVRPMRGASDMGLPLIVFLLPHSLLLVILMVALVSLLVLLLLLVYLLVLSSSSCSSSPPRPPSGRGRYCSAGLSGRIR